MTPPDMRAIWRSRGSPARSSKPRNIVAEGKRGDSKRRTPGSRPGASGQGRSRPAVIPRRESRGSTGKADAENAVEAIAGPIRRAIVASLDRQNEQRLGFTARRAAILAAVVCVLTLTIAGPVRTYFAQRTEMKQLAAAEATMRKQISDLEQQKEKLADPVYVAAQARERLGFVMPGDIPYQVQLPASAVQAAPAEEHAETAKNSTPWYTSLWHTVADTPHGPPAPAAPEPAPPGAPVPDAPAAPVPAGG